ncbi:fimbria/pilus periplasmic chaperone [Mesorhizobium sp. NBSH29]|uniref:fimbrial biogenesis chaperone n=1 Tax=Mesorhizobium sp. NBSH29 TaxID=2654249 RepID=UPI0018966604|nr:fimbria/pilus periplasmic chaperone [Mesorhizobium sp. NBSH29]QPC85454.1 fimbria/pilus periplasmic chaperone [Mesorhizobium sp. NBSH29]
MTLLSILAFTLLSISIPFAHAASLSVSPVSLDLSANLRTATVQVENRGGAKVSFQARVMNWAQVDGKDVLTSTQSVVVSPPVASIDPGVAYTFRILHKGRPSSGEETYRLLIDELPNVNVKRPATSVSMLVQQSIPIFFSSPDAAAELIWNIVKVDEGYEVSAMNTGNRHAKISNLKLDSYLVKRGLAGYVLPGNRRTWFVENEFAELRMGESVSITAKSSDYGISTSVIVSNK